MPSKTIKILLLFFALTAQALKISAQAKNDTLEVHIVINRFTKQIRLYNPNNSNLKYASIYKGTIVKDLFYNGKLEFYNEEGVLDHVEIFVDGKYIGDGTELRNTKDDIFIGSIPIFSATGDSINRYDLDEKKEGRWVVYGHMTNQTGYHPNAVVESGQYFRSRKTGEWKKFRPDGSLQNIIHYEDGKYKGTFESYYPNGKLEERGNMSGGLLKGIYEYYFPSGCIQQLKVYDENGMAVVHEFYEDNCNDSQTGNLDLERSSTPEGGYRLMDRGGKVVENVSGFCLVYNKKGQLIFEGEIQQGKFWEGKNYSYPINDSPPQIKQIKEGN